MSVTVAMPFREYLRRVDEANEYADEKVRGHFKDLFEYVKKNTFEECERAMPEKLSAYFDALDEYYPNRRANVLLIRKLREVVDYDDVINLDIDDLPPFCA